MIRELSTQVGELHSTLKTLQECQSLMQRDNAPVNSPTFTQLETKPSRFYSHGSPPTQEARNQRPKSNLTASQRNGRRQPSTTKYTPITSRPRKISTAQPTTSDIKHTTRSAQTSATFKEGSEEVYHLSDPKRYQEDLEPNQDLMNQLYPHRDYQCHASMRTQLGSSMKSSEQRLNEAVSREF